MGGQWLLNAMPTENLLPIEMSSLVWEIPDDLTTFFLLLFLRDSLSRSCLNTFLTFSSDFCTRLIISIDSTLNSYIQSIELCLKVSKNTTKLRVNVSSFEKDDNTDDNITSDHPEHTYFSSLFKHFPLNRW